jgi:hypothetical protein
MAVIYAQLIVVNDDTVSVPYDLSLADRPTTLQAEACGWYVKLAGEKNVTG